MSRQPPSAQRFPTQPRAPAPPGHPQRGLGAITAILVLVVMAAMAAAVLRMGRLNQTTSQQDTQGLRASSAARAGLEWGLYQALKGSWTSCSGASQTLDLGTDLGMRVVVGCNSQLYNEGEASPGTPATVRVFTIDAVACNSSTCPDATAATRESYVERRRQVVAVN